MLVELNMSVHSLLDSECIVLYVCTYLRKIVAIELFSGKFNAGKLFSIVFKCLWLDIVLMTGYDTLNITPA